MIRISKILFLLAVVIYFVSCEKYTFLDVPMIPEDTVFYRADIQPIFDTKCIRCHNATLDPDLRPENSYKALTDGGYVTLPAEESVLYKKGLTSASHTSYTDQTERGKILAWIYQGAEDN